jgi:enolase-phosphatase E1
VHGTKLLGKRLEQVDSVGNPTLIEISARGVLLDIEGTTSSIAFVHDVMFPYVRRHVRQFLLKQASNPEVAQACRLILQEAANPKSTESTGTDTNSLPIDAVEAAVNRLMDEDRKSTGLKALQGMVWRQGFEEKILKAHLFPEVPAAIQGWRAAGLDVRIYSSGSIAAQKLFFGHTEFGNLLYLFTDHYDTTIGGKKDMTSYQQVAGRFSLDAQQIVFVSDIEAEIDAAHLAGMQVIASCRPGNAPLSANCPYARIGSFAELSIVCR